MNEPTIDTVTKQARKWTIALDALLLWSEWLEKGIDPLNHVDLYQELSRCYYCGGLLSVQNGGGVIKHLDDCVYIRAKSLVDEAKELTDEKA